VLWLVAPLLSLDASDSGHEGALQANRLWDQAWDAVLNHDQSLVSKTEELITASEELHLAEEPKDASVYRVDFLAALLYAVRTYSVSTRKSCDGVVGVPRTGGL
jgi:hypothetical protein